MTENRRIYLSLISNEEAAVRQRIEEFKTNISVLKSSLSLVPDAFEIDEAERKKLIKGYQISIKMLKFRIPMKPIKVKVLNLLFNICPSCYNEICSGDKFCEECGQRLSWKE